MIFRQKHISFVGALLVLLLLVANSGFTVALHSCLMSERGCCESMPMEMPAPQPANGPGLHLVGVDGNCCQVTVAGGLNANPVVNEHPSSLTVQKLVALGEMPEVSVVAIGNNSAFSRFLSSSSERVAPLPVEKYVLNSVFLI